MAALRARTLPTDGPVPLAAFEDGNLILGGICTSIHPTCPHVYNLGEQDEGATNCIFFSQNHPHFKISPNASSGQVLGDNVCGGLEGAAHSSFSDCLATRAG